MQRCDKHYSYYQCHWIVFTQGSYKIFCTPLPMKTKYLWRLSPITYCTRHNLLSHVSFRRDEVCNFSGETLTDVFIHNTAPNNPDRPFVWQTGREQNTYQCSTASESPPWPRQQVWWILFGNVHIMEGRKRLGRNKNLLSGCLEKQIT